VIVALEAFEPRRAIIIVGGYDKGADFDKMGAALAARAKAVVAIGKTRDKIVAAAKAAMGRPGTPGRQSDAPAIELADTLESAVRAARRLAAPGDVILLSPACASYDMFTNYEQRGNLFVEMVKAS
jgi:UDP-N-acetylmuramoylalanine--D-glutamate ligase